jgi:hypothetical protein
LESGLDGSASVLQPGETRSTRGSRHKKASS